MQAPGFPQGLQMRRQAPTLGPTPRTLHRPRHPAVYDASGGYGVFPGGERVIEPQGNTPYQAAVQEPGAATTAPLPQTHPTRHYHSYT